MSGYIGKPYLGKPRPPQLTPGIDGSLNPELSCWYWKDIGHLKENCIKLNRRLTLGNRQPEKNNTDWLLKQLENRSPLVMDQTKGEKKSGPHTNNEEKDLIC